MTRVPKRVVNEIQDERPYTVSKPWFDGNFRDKFPKTTEWLDNNPYLTYEDMKFDYLITLLIRGYDIEEEEGVVLIDAPNSYFKYIYIERRNIGGKYNVSNTDLIEIILKYATRFTEEEAKAEFPTCRWVSLEELELSEKLKNDNLNY